MKIFWAVVILKTKGNVLAGSIIIASKALDARAQW